MKKSKKDTKGKRINLANFGSSDDILTEAFRMLRLYVDSIIEECADSDSGASILITSALQSEGKTTVSCNLALACASSGIKTLLIDGDLRNPNVHRAFEMDKEPGLSGYLLKEITGELPVRPSVHKNLSILTAGRSIKQSTELLASSAASDLIKTLRSQFQLVIVDSPPIGLVSDAGILASKVNNTYLVVRAGKTSRRVVEKAVETFWKLGAEISGIILSRFNVKSNRYLYYSDYPSYYSSYYREDKS